MSCRPPVRARSAPRRRWREALKDRTWRSSSGGIEPLAEREPKRVVVTGVGAITAQGPTADALWEGVVGGRVASRNGEGLPMDGYRTKLGGEVQERVGPEREYRHPDDYREPVIDFAMKASEEA